MSLSWAPGAGVGTTITSGFGPSGAVGEYEKEPPHGSCNKHKYPGQAAITIRRFFFRFFAASSAAPSSGVTGNCSSNGAGRSSLFLRSEEKERHQDQAPPFLRASRAGFFLLHLQFCFFSHEKAAVMPYGKILSIFCFHGIGSEGFLQYSLKPWPAPPSIIFSCCASAVNHKKWGISILFA